MLNYSKVIICGRLTANPELKITSPGNKKVCSFDIAYNSTKDIAHFFTCVAWESKAEFLVANFRKGSPIFVEGELVQRKFKDKDGNNRSVVEIRVSEIKFVETKEEKMAREAGVTDASAPTAFEAAPFVPAAPDVFVPTDDLPF